MSRGLGEVQRFVLAELARRDAGDRRCWAPLPELVEAWALVPRFGLVDEQVGRRRRNVFRELPPPERDVADVSVRRAVHLLDQRTPPLVELKTAANGRRQLLVRRTRDAVALAARDAVRLRRKQAYRRARADLETARRAPRNP